MLNFGQKIPKVKLKMPKSENGKTLKYQMLNFGQKITKVKLKMPKPENTKKLHKTGLKFLPHFNFLIRSPSFGR